MDYKDEIGNIIRWGSGRCFLRIVGSGKGFVELGHMGGIDRKIFIIYRDSKKHMMHSVRGYGFNNELLRRFLIPESIDIGLNIDNKVKYLLDPAMIIELGQYLYFKTSGFEKQVFLPLATIEQIAKWKGEITPAPTLL